MDDRQRKKRYAELAELSRRQRIYHYTEFLTPAEAAEACSAAPERERALFGGAEGCERVMVRFGDPDECGYEEPFPLAVLRIAPRDGRFAEELTHRDYLGALMHLGLERSVFGDVLVRDGRAYVFAAERMADYLCRELTQVRHTFVTCEVLPEVPEDARPQLEPLTVTAASARLDLLLAKVFRLSRTKAKELFAAGHVQVGGRVCEKESVVPGTGDVVSVRGYGKFRYGGEEGVTKKGNRVLRIERYS